ncbi:hypothetical protein Leryth_021262 [Lithospermum erythrorhizon]|nr:hypothetical protein Leryth_021262 [Lithospermum erythrorhizon]
MVAPTQAIEITVISGEDLFLSRKQRVRRNAYAIVKTDTSNSQTTNEDKVGGSNPTWNEKLTMNLPNHARYLIVEVHCKTSSGDKIVGVANVPTSDFLGGYGHQGYLHFLSYRLRDLNSEKNGIINIAVGTKIIENTNSDYGFSGETKMGSQECRTEIGIPIDGTKMSSGMVAGFPVGYNSYK